EDLGLGRWSMRIQYKPLVRYICLGALVMAIGGGLAALDRRYRIIADDAAKKADQALSGGGPTGRPVPGAASTSTAAQRGA
ncbi:MAG: cytochrome c-type biogenesis CcmF C-terminal domain-containing protein, partial [Pseudomonadota bacterium]